VPFRYDYEATDQPIDTELTHEVEIGLTKVTYLLLVCVKTSSATNVHVEVAFNKPNWFPLKTETNVTEFSFVTQCNTRYVRLRVEPVSGATCDYLICITALS